MRTHILDYPVIINDKELYPKIEFYQCKCRKKYAPFPQEVKGIGSNLLLMDEEYNILLPQEHSHHIIKEDKAFLQAHFTRVDYRIMSENFGKGIIHRVSGDGIEILSSDYGVIDYFHIEGRFEDTFEELKRYVAKWDVRFVSYKDLLRRALLQDKKPF